MKRPFSPRSSFRHLALTSVSMAVLMAPGCKKNDEAEAETKTEASADAEADGGAAASKAAASSRGNAPAARIGDRGAVLGHVLLPNGSEFLTEVKNQLAVPQVAPFVDEGFLRGMLAGQLGQRSGLSQNVLLDKPIGCAVLDPKAFEMPAACHLSYKGGLDQLVKDLGEEGKQADAGDHAAHYTIEGQSLFVDALGDSLVVSGHTEVFGKSKAYIESNLLGRAPKVASDIELVAYAGPILDKYRDDIAPLLELASAPRAFDKTGDPKLDAVMQTWTDYNAKSTKDTMERIGEMEQVTLGLGLEQIGLVVRFAIFPADGSRLQKESQANLGGPVDQGLMGKLPETSWFTVASSYNRKGAWNTQTSIELRELFSKSYGDLTGKSPKKVDQAITEFYEESANLYQDQTSFAVAHERDTLGGMLFVQPLRDGQSGRDSWKAWTKDFSPDNILPKDYRDYLTWSFAADAATVDGVPVDRWTIEPGAKAKAELEKELAREADARAFVEKFGGLKLVIDRVEKGGLVTYVFAPKAEEAYTKVALAAQAGTGNLAGDAGLQKIARRHPAANGVFASNAKGALRWIKDIVPEKEGKDIPSDIGNDLGDLFFAMTGTEEGLSTGEFVLSQALIDQLRALAQKQQ